MVSAFRLVADQFQCLVVVGGPSRSAAGALVHLRPDRPHPVRARQRRVAGKSENTQRAGQGEQAFLNALDRAVAFGRWRAADLLRRLSTGS